MPRPTVAQLAYGSATVVCSTIAMVLLSQTSSGPGVGVIAMSALILGVFVALSVPARKPGPAAEPAPAEERVPAQRLTSTLSSSTTTDPARDPGREQAREQVREPAGP